MLPELAESFADELMKIALSNPLASALTMAVPGALIGGASAASRQPENASTWQKAKAIGGGALVGGAATGAVGGVAGLHGGTGKVIGDFGRRQVHALTGYVPKGMGNLERAHSIGIGNDLPAMRLEANRLRSAAEGKSGIRGWWANRKATGAAEAITGLENDTGHAARERLIEHGATSIPGFIKGMAGSDRGQILGDVAKDAWSGGAVGKGMLLAGTAMGVHGDLKETDPVTGKHRGWGERIGGAVGSTAGLVLPSTVPFAGQMLGGTVIGGVGKRMGRAMDSVIPSGPKQDYTHPSVSSAYQSAPTISASPSAMGKSYGAGMEQ